MNEAIEGLSGIASERSIFEDQVEVWEFRSHGRESLCHITPPLPLMVLASTVRPELASGLLAPAPVLY